MPVRKRRGRLRRPAVRRIKKRRGAEALRPIGVVQSALLHQRQHFFFKEFRYLFGLYGVELIVHGNADAFLAAAYAEDAAEVDFVFELALGYLVLEPFDYAARAFYVAGASYADFDFYHFVYLPSARYS